MGNVNMGEPLVQHNRIMCERKRGKVTLVDDHIILLFFNGNFQSLLSSSHHHHPSLMARKNTTITSDSDDENLPQATRGSRQRISSTKQSEIGEPLHDRFLNMLINILQIGPLKSST